ncbi:hypothetical protein HU200_050232 [Digitaria exilis]|uniref:Uncharacterized protein n=1 Tax=Digitaria exilis TaxID=1010633 RepID=A0A835AXE9_9POAL|nr:hypothetical protein HU200_050232 [Digitaria exilis]CAB3473398.1 unnamed protein product [Digitaria exilis]
MAAIPAAISGCCSSSRLSQPAALLRSTSRRRFKVTAMAPMKKVVIAALNQIYLGPSLLLRSEIDPHCYVMLLQVNRYDDNWSKQWFGAGIFAEGSEEVSVDVLKKLERRKVLSTVEKAGLLSKAEELGLTLSSLERLGLLSKAEDLGLLSLVETAAGASPSALASSSLPLLAAAVAAVVLVPDDSAALVAAQAVVAAVLAAGAAGLFVGSVVLAGLQESD